MRRYVSLWREMFLLSWRRMPGFVIGALAALTGTILVTAAVALALRATVNAVARGATSTAVVAAVLAALFYALTMVLRDMDESMVRTISDRIGRREMHPAMYKDIATIEGLEHLEHPAYLDRLAVMRAAATRLPGAMWISLAVLANVARIVLTTLLLATVSPWLLILIIFSIVPVWFDRRGQRYLKQTEMATAEQYRLQQHLFDLTVTPSSSKELKTATASDEIVRLQHETWDEAMRRRYRAQVVSAGWKLAGWSLFVAGFVGGLGLVAYQTAHGHGTLGDIVLAVVVTASLRPSVAATVESMSMASMAAGLVVDPYLWLRGYAEADRARRRSTAAAPDALRSGIALEEVTYTYPGSPAPALDAISIELPAGSVVAVVGEYGSGKTTLVKLLSKFYRPDSGRILIDGTDLSLIGTAGWRARCSAAFQDFGRFRTRFSEAIGLGDLPNLENRERIEAAVRAADAESLVSRLPSGFDTQLGVELGGVDLSEGQWQRTALARASMRDDPLLFVLDEPTASIDAPGEQEIYERYMSRARDFAQRTGGVSVIVSHRFGTVKGADLILVLDNGRLVEAGGHQELLDLNGRYADLYGLHIRAYL